MNMKPPAAVLAAARHIGSNGSNPGGGMSTFPHFATNAIHVGQDPEQWNSHAVVPPISPATTFKQINPGETKGYDYSRGGNPTRKCLEECLASLEDAKFCSAFSSGLSATAAVIGMLKPGDHVLSTDDIYGGSNRYMRRIAAKGGIESSLVDLSNLDNVKAHIQPNTKFIWMESPTNPLLKLCDLRSICDLARSVNPEILLICDNTFMSPYFQRPLDLGCDIVIHSITKYINGHTDVVMGCAMTNKPEISEHLKFYQMAAGAVISSFDAFLVNRGIKTLHVRMECHQRNGMAVARFLEGHPAVERVFYPGLPSHPQHELHKRQTKGMSGMVSFYIRGGIEESKKFFKNLKVFVLAESLGGYESLADHPAIMTHASVPEEERIKLGISDSLIRLSVGIEDTEDLIEDLDQALKAVLPASKEKGQ